MARGKPLRVGFTYNERRGSADEEPEFDEPATLDAIRRAIRALGHDVVDLEATRELPARLAGANVDVVFNFAEGTGRRSREAVVPALLDWLGIPYTGSDPVTMGLTLDKALAKAVVAANGIATPDWAVLERGDEPLPDALRFPLFVKPLHEGSSNGIGARSVVADEDELRAGVRGLTERFRQPALVEAHVEGRELTVAVLGSPPRVLPPLEILFPNGTAHVYDGALKHAEGSPVRWQVPAPLERGTLEALERTVLDCWRVLGCRDVARLDFRLDAEGRAWFLECNPIPGLQPDWSDLCLITAAAGIGYEELIGEILDGALARAS